MFSIRSLLIATALAAIFVVAFLDRSEAWASIIVTLTILLLAAAGMAIYLVPSRRPFLICAVTMGVTYGSIALIRPLGLSHSLVTSRVLFGIWYSEQQGNLTDVAYAYWLFIDAPDPGSLLTAETMTAFRSFQQIGHCAVAVMLAVIAGLLGSYVARRRDFNARVGHVQS
jgi:hypothetical protein